MSDGRVVELEINTDAVDGHARRWGHVSTVQNAMSNLLSSIGQTGEGLARVKLDLEAKDSVLEQLAIAGSLLQNRPTSSVQCSIVACLDDTSSPRCSVSASLSNTARFTLGHNWTFVVSLSPSSRSCICKDHTASSSRYMLCDAADNCSLYTSRDVSGLLPGMTESLSLVVDLDRPSSTEVSHIVRTALVYTPMYQADAEMKQVSVPLASRVVDILDFVRPASSSARCLQSSRRTSFVSECRKLRQICRPQVRDDSDPMSVDEPESKKKNVAAVKEHSISLYASKSHNTQGTDTDLLFFLGLQINRS